MQASVPARAPLILGRSPRRANGSPKTFPSRPRTTKATEGQTMHRRFLGSTKDAVQGEGNEERGLMVARRLMVLVLCASGFTLLLSAAPALAAATAPKIEEVSVI